MDRLQLGQTFHFANQTLSMTYDDIVAQYNDKHKTDYTRGWVSRLILDYKNHNAQHKLINFPGGDYELELPRYDHPPHIYANSPTDVVFVDGDRHLPFLNVPMNNAKLAHMRWYKRKGYRVLSVCVGDFANNDALSKHPKLKTQIAMKHTRASAQASTKAESDVADEIYYLRGNHDDWFARYLDGVLDVNDYWNAILGGIDRTKVRTIDSTKAVIHNCGTDWRVTHMYEHSKIPGRKVNTIAQKYDMNTITFHEHSLNVSRDNWNRLTTIACGMMANRAILEYVNDYDNTHNVMKNSYVVLCNGKFQVMTPYRDWQDWTQYDIDPLPLYEEENEQQQVMTGKLDIMRWMEESEAAA